jgi:hypothetical protein
MFKRSLRLFIVIAGLLLISSNIFSQEDTIPVRDDQQKKPPGDITHYGDFGIGYGLDYGGAFGVQLEVVPLKHLAFFAACGYYIYQFGYQVGTKLLFVGKTSRKGIRPFLKGMYGTNSVIITDLDEYNKVYAGFTVGFGCEFRFGRKKKNGFDLDLNLPIRTPDFWEDWQAVENDPRLEVIQGPIPVAFSAGFHHEF